MRVHGMVSSPAGLGVHDHACWAFASEDELHTAVLAYLREGRRLGKRLVYVGGKDVDALRRDLDGLADADSLIEGGALQLFSLSAIYGVGEPLDPPAQLATYAAATEQALAEGYTGLHVAAEVTALVRDRVSWEAHLRWEALADRYMASNPMSAMCCYDLRELPEEIVADLASLHPAEGPDRVAPFRLYSEPDSLRLAGDVDYFSAADLDRLLDLTPESEDHLVLDLGGLDFINHDGVLSLAAFRDRLAARGKRLTLRGGPPTLAPMRDLLGVEL